MNTYDVLNTIRVEASNAEEAVMVAKDQLENINTDAKVLRCWKVQ